MKSNNQLERRRPWITIVQRGCRSSLHPRDLPLLTTTCSHNDISSGSGVITWSNRHTDTPTNRHYWKQYHLRYAITAWLVRMKVRQLRSMKSTTRQDLKGKQSFKFSYACCLTCFKTKLTASSVTDTRERNCKCDTWSSTSRWHDLWPHSSVLQAQLTAMTPQPPTAYVNEQLDLQCSMQTYHHSNKVPPAFTL